MGLETNVLPDLPFPSRINPATRLLEAHLERLMTALQPSGIDSLARLRAAGFHHLAGRMFPHASELRLAAISEVVLWLFVVDDYLDPGMPGSDPGYRAILTQKIDDLLAGETAADTALDPIRQVAARFRTQILPLAGPRWWGRFAANVLQFVESIRQEAGVHAMGKPPDRQTYLARRQSTSGWRLLVDLVEFEAEMEFPDEFIAFAPCNELYAAAADVACAINDLLSLRKELAAGELHNLVLVLQHERGCTLADAVTHTRAWIDNRLEDYFAARALLLNRYARVDDVARLVRGVENLMRGSVDWSHESGRYRAARSEIDVASHDSGIDKEELHR